MDFKFSKGSEKQEGGEQVSPKKNQNAMVALLLILLGGFGYLYFFTGLIKPQQEATPVAPPPVQTVKKPLPPRDSSDVKVEGGEPKKVAVAESVKTAPPAPAAVKAEVPKAPSPTPAKLAVASKAQVVAKEIKNVDKKTSQKEPTPPPKAEVAKKTVPMKIKPVAVSPKSTEAKKGVEASSPVAAKKAPPVKKAAPAESAVKENANGEWSVVVGNYILEEALGTDLVKVRKAGLEAYIQSGGRKKAAMNRLQVGEFADRQTAQVELEKLKKHTSDGFIIDNGGKFAVYAGSYLLDSRVASEKERLGAAGYHVAVKHVEVFLPTKQLNAGKFKDKKSAEVALKKLKSSGLTPTLKQP